MSTDPKHSHHGGGADHHHGDAAGHHHGHARHGAKQPEVFDPSRAALLDDPQRFTHLPPVTLLALLDTPVNGTVVDFGTGTGTFAIELATRRPDVRVIALDEQPAMLALLQQKPVVGELRNLQPLLADQAASIRGTADRILAVNVLHEVGDEVLREMGRLLKPDGALLVVDWDSAIERPMGPPRDHTHTAAEARSRLAQAGFEVTSLPSLPYHFVLRARRSGAGQSAAGR